MLSAVAALIIGFLVLAWSADRFVFGAAATARNLGISPLIVGLTVVGFGTSAPELTVSAFAAWQGNPQLALGNALGSNIANVGMVLGIAAVISPLTVRSQILKREYPVMVAVMVLALLLLLDGRLSRLDGVILLGALVLLIYWMVRVGLKERAANHARSKKARQAVTDPLTREYEQELKGRVPTWVALGWLALGLALLVGSSRLLVWGATTVATYYGVSDLIIGLSIVALGTSLPEVATTVASGLKGEDDIALGNILGSNMFNMLGVVGVAGLLHPVAPAPGLLGRDFPVMFLISFALLLMLFRHRGTARITALEGGLLLAGYGGYLLLLARSLVPGS